MALPTVGIPTYELTLPSNGQVVKVKPFLVKQEKILLMAVESKDDMEIINATKQVLKECILEDIDLEKLPFFDIDYLFIGLRAKSIGETIPLSFYCENIVDDAVCGGVFKADINITDATINKREDITNTIQLDAKITIKMKYPSYSIMRLLPENDNIMDRKIKVIANCIEQIVDGKKVSSAKDYTKQELIAFVENLTSNQFQKLELFVDNFPTFSVKASSTCPKCGHTHNIDYKDFTSFFQ